MFDEVYERMIYMDVLFGLLKKCCVKRKDLKIIVMLVILDVEKFLMYFFDCFIFIIFGWMFFVEVLYIKVFESDYFDVVLIMVM